MKRRLVITNEVFVQVLFLAFMSTRMAPGVAQARLGRDIKNKFLGISEPDEHNGIKLKALEKPELEFTQAEFEHLSNCLEKFEYNTEFVDRVADTMDWFSAADKL